MNKKFLLVMLTSCIIILAIIFGIKVNCFLKSTTNKVSTMMVQEPLSKKIQAYYYKISPHSHVMYGFLRRAYYMFGIPKKGLIHIGARYAEELSYYLDYDINNILWVEADPEAEAKLKQIVQKHSGSKVAMFAATDANGIITFNKTSNDGHSSSILKLKNHLLHYPGIVENKTFQVESRRLDDYLSPKEQQKYNILVLDIQGAELVALKGATNMLDSIDAIITETNYDELYEGAVLIKDLDAFLATYQFTRVESASAAFYTGDALYIKDKFFKQVSNK